MGGRREKKISTLAEELHKPVRRKFKRRRVLVNGIDKIWAPDLADMQAFSKFNRGIKYLLAVIDVFSKYGWLIPLKDKTGKSVASALKTIFKERKPEMMWVDKGKEFYNKDVKELIELYSTENEEKSSVVERWIRTMKEKMWKYFTTNSTNVYINVLPDLVREYNNTRHSSIKMSPVEASEKKNEFKVWKTLYPNRLDILDINPKFSVGDKVRISKKKELFEKGYTTRWTEEIFTITKIKHTSVVRLCGEWDSSIHSFTHSLIHSFTHLLIYSFTHSLIHSFTHSLIHSLTHSFTHSFD